MSEYATLPPMKRLNIGYIALAVAQSCVGFNIVISKSVTQVLPIHLFMEMRFAVVTLFLFCFVKICKQNLWLTQDGITGISRQEWKILFLQALCGTLLFNTLILSGLKFTTASTAGIIASCTPALIAIFAYLVLKETLTVAKLVALSVAVLGLFVIAFGTYTQVALSKYALLGDGLVFLALIHEALFTILAKFSGRRIAPGVTAVWIGAFATLLFFPMAFFEAFTFSWHTLSFHTLRLILLSAMTSSGFFVCWAKGLQTVPANLSALFVGMMPITAIIAGHFMLGEVLNRFDFIGLICVLISIAIGVLSMLRPTPIQTSVA